MARHLRNDRQAYFALASTTPTPHRAPSPPVRRRSVPLRAVLLGMGLLAGAAYLYPYIVGV